MKKCLALALIPLLAWTANAAPAAYPITIDSRAVSTPQIEAYKGGQLVVRVSFKDGGTASDITSLTPFMTWSTNATASTVATSAYSVVTATNGTCDFTFTGANMNYAGGRYIYEVGLIQTNAQVSVYRQGVLLIRGSPYASGGASVAWGTNMNWSLINWLGLPTTLAGYGILNAVTNTDPAYLLAFTNAVAGTNINIVRSGRIITVNNTAANADTNAAVGIATNLAIQDILGRGYITDRQPTNWWQYTALNTINVGTQAINGVTSIVFDASGTGGITMDNGDISTTWGAVNGYEVFAKVGKVTANTGYRIGFGSQTNGTVRPATYVSMSDGRIVGPYAVYGGIMVEPDALTTNAIAITNGYVNGIIGTNAGTGMVGWTVTSSGGGIVATNCDTSDGNVTFTLPAPVSTPYYFSKTNALNSVLVIYNATTTTVSGIAVIEALPIGSTYWSVRY